MKKRILVVTEITTLQTGFARYGKNLLKLLQKNGHEVFEFSIGLTRQVPELDWDFELNQPSSQEEEQIYNANVNNVNGQYKFEKVLLDFKPDYVIDIRDPYAYAYQSVSPFRNIFHWNIVATADGIPQRRQWLELFKNADGVFVYTNWAKNILEEYNIRVDGVAAPSTTECYRPKDKIKLKEKFGISEYKVLGSILRNQPRKLIPELFNGFREYLNQTGDKNTVILLSSSWPDVGWNIPDLLIHYGLSSRVLITYNCQSCKHFFPSFYRGVRSFCPNCKRPDVRTCELSDNISDDQMSDILGCFDSYIQLASREGFGMPMLEALMCNIPVLAINYASMHDFKNEYDISTIEPDVYKFSHDMEMYDAYVSPLNIADGIKEILSVKTPKVIPDTSWEKSLQPIINHINNSNFKAEWNTNFDIKNIPEYTEINASNYDYAKYLIEYVLQRPEYINSLMFTRLVDELNCGVTFGRYFGTYLIEPTHMRGQVSEFTREIAYEYIKIERERINYWETIRMESFK